MSKFLNGLLLGLILGAAGYWFVEKKAKEHPEAERRFEDAAARARETTSAAAHDMSDAVKAKLETLNLKADDVKDELARTGKIVRRKARETGEKMVDAATDARIVTAIKAKYVADSDISALKISVSSDHGHVNLSGTVSAPESVAKAVSLAFDTEGVLDVTYSLEVKP